MGGDPSPVPPPPQSTFPSAQEAMRWWHDTLILRNQECGNFQCRSRVDRLADPSPYARIGLPLQRLDANSLLELAFLLEQLTNKVEKKRLNNELTKYYQTSCLRGLTLISKHSSSACESGRPALLRKLPPLATILEALSSSATSLAQVGCKCAKGRGHGPKYYLP